MDRAKKGEVVEGGSKAGRRIIRRRAVEAKTGLGRSASRNLWDADSQTSSLISTAITSTQFLRNTGLSTDGYLDGRFYEFLLYEGTLDNATTFAVEGFLASKYGIGLG